MWGVEMQLIQKKDWINDNYSNGNISATAANYRKNKYTELRDTKIVSVKTDGQMQDST